MSKEITKGILYLFDKEGKEITFLEHDFADIKYNYLVNEENEHSVEFIFATYNIKDKMPYYNFLKFNNDKIQNIGSIKFDYVLKDNTTSQEEILELYNSNILHPNANFKFEFNSGTQLVRLGSGFVNDLYYSTLMKFTYRISN